MTLDIVVAIVVAVVHQTGWDERRRSPGGRRHVRAEPSAQVDDSGGNGDGSAEDEGPANDGPLRLASLSACIR